MVACAVFYSRKKNAEIADYELAIMGPFEKMRDVLILQIINCIMSICAVRMSDFTQVMSELISDIKHISTENIVLSEKYELMMRLFRQHPNTDKLIFNEISRANKLIKQAFDDQFSLIGDPVEFRERADQMIEELEKASEDLQRVLKDEAKVNGSRAENIIRLLEHKAKDEAVESRIAIVGE